MLRQTRVGRDLGAVCPSGQQRSVTGTGSSTDAYPPARYVTSELKTAFQTVYDFSSLFDYRPR